MTKTHVVSMGAVDVEFRKGKSEDVYRISELTRGDKLLYRSPEEVELLLPCYHVAVLKQTEEIIGCISAKMYGNDAEIISFRVVDEFLGIGIGAELLGMQLRFLGARTGISRIFALTTKKVATGSFRQAGFAEVGIHLFGPKVLLECTKCKKNVFIDGKHLCDEIAVIYAPAQF